MTASRLFNGDLLRADVFAPGRDRLFVTFRQRLDRPGAFTAPRPVRRFIDAGYTHLHLQARRNDWYVNPETEALETVLSGFSDAFAAAAGMGFSMGGYAALRFAAALRLDHLIAVSPQYSIAPEHVPFDRRWRASAGGFDPALGDLRGRGTDVRGLILADPFRPMDILNAGMILQIFPGLELARLGGGGHPATRVLGEAGRFGQLQALLLDAPVRRSAVLTLHRASRHGSRRYWRHLAQAAWRHGRPDLAARAQAMVRAPAQARTRT